MNLLHRNYHWLLTFFFLQCISVSVPFNAQAQTPIATRGVVGDLWADLILGQPDFGDVKPNEATSQNLFNPSNVLVDQTNDVLYVWDSVNNRLLGVHHVTQSSLGQGADMVLGQADFVHAGCNRDSNWQTYDWHLAANGIQSLPVLPNASCLCGDSYKNQSPGEGGSTANMAVDKEGNLYVPDYFNNRVLRYDFGATGITTGQSASHVWGQLTNGQEDFTGYMPDNIGNNVSGNVTSWNLDFSQSGNDYAAGVAVDDWGNLWVADAHNNRVLRFPATCNGCVPQSLADVVLGQPDFVHNDPTSVITDAVGMLHPVAVRVDDSGNVYVGEAYGSSAWGRILVFRPTSTGAQAVYANGQAALTVISVFATVSSPSSPVTLNPVAGLEMDLTASLSSSGGSTVALWATDENQGIFQFQVGWSASNPPVITSISVPKQIGMGGYTRGSVGVAQNGDVYVPHRSGQRILRFDAPLSQLPTVVWNNTNVFKNSTVAGGSPLPNNIGDIGLYEPGGVIVPAWGGVTQVIVADQVRLHYWNLGVGGLAGFSNGQPEDGYAGTKTPYVFNPFAKYTNIDADTTSPNPGYLWAGQVTGNNQPLQIVAFRLPLTSAQTEGSVTISSPVSVLGGTGFGAAVTLEYITGLAVDPLTGDVWISEQGDSRVLRIHDPLGRSGGPYVDILLGQPNATATGCNITGNSPPYNNPCNVTTPSQSSLNYPGPLKLDPYGDLFVSDHSLEDYGNLRMLRWDVKSLPPGGSFTTCRFEIPADGVYGTGGSFTTYRVCHEGPCPSGADAAAYSWQMAFNHDASIMVAGTDSQLSGLPPIIIQNPRNGIEPPSVADTPGAGDNPIGYLNDFGPQSYGVAFDLQDNLYVTEWNRSRLLVYRQPFQAMNLTPTDTPTGTLTPSMTPTPTLGSATPTPTTMGTFTWTPTITPTGTPTFTLTPTLTPCGLPLSWPVQQPAGVAVDAAGNAYVADDSAGLIDVFNPQGTPVTPIGSGGITLPVGVAVDGNGKVYVTDEVQGFYTMGQVQYRVDVFDGSGAAVTQWGTNGTSSGVFEAPIGIAVNSAGTSVYIADQNTEQVEVFNGLGSPITQWGLPGTTGNETFGYPVGIALDASGNVYVADWDTGLVQVFDGQGRWMRQWDVTQGTPLLTANFIAVYGDCLVYVDDGFGEVGIFDTNGNPVGSIQSWNTGQGDTGFYQAEGLAVDGNQNLYVADSANDQLFKFGACPVTVCPVNLTATPTWTFTFTPVPPTDTFTPDPTATFTPTWTDTYTPIPPTDTYTPTPSFTWTPTETYTPGCCQVAASVTAAGVLGYTVLNSMGTTLYVADFGAQRVDVFQVPGMVPNGTITGFANPYAMAMGRDGYLYVGDYGVSMVYKVDVNSGSKAATFGPVAGPVRGIAVDSAANNYDVYVSYDAGPGQVEVFRQLAPGSAAATLNDSSLSLSPRGLLKQGTKLYVADAGNSQVYELDQPVTGGYNFGAAQTVVGNTHLQQPCELAMDGSSNLYVASYTNSEMVVYKADATADPTVFTFDHECPTSGVQPQGVAVDGSGYIYAAASGAGGAMPYEVLQLEPCGGIFTPTPDPTNTPTWTPTKTDTPTWTFTFTPVPPTNTFTPDPTDTFTYTYTSTPDPTDTPTWTNTFTPDPTATYTSTWTDTYTPIPPTDTYTPTPSFTWTPTATYTPDCCQVAQTVTGQGGTGGAFNSAGPEAIYQDTLYVVDINNNRVQKFQLGGGVPSVISPAGVLPVTFNDPYSAAVAGQYLYVGDFADGKIVKVDLVTNAATTVATAAGQILGMAVDPASGEIYASLWNVGVQVLTSAGASQTVLSNGMGGAPRGLWKSGNRLYVADSGNDRILTFDEGVGGVFSGPQTVIPAVSGPYQITMDGNGNIYVATSVSQQIDEYDTNYNHVRACPVGMPVGGVAVDVHGNVYASGGAGSAGEVVEITSCMANVLPTATFTLTPVPPTNTFTPTPDPTATYTPGCCQVAGSVTTAGVLGALALNGNMLYVADFGAQRVDVFQVPGMVPNGTITGFANPYAMAMGRDGYLYVGDYGVSMVYKVDVNSGSKAATIGPVAGPIRGIAVDSAANNYDVYVSYDAGPGQIEVFRQSAPGSVAATLNDSSLSLSPRGLLKQGTKLYVADAGNSQVYELDQPVTGGYNFGAAQTVVGNTHLQQPCELAMDGSSNLYVASYTNNQMVVYRANMSADPTVFAFDHACPTTGVQPQGVAVDGSGYIYAAASGTGGVPPYEVLQLAPCGGAFTPTPDPTNTPNWTSTFTPVPVTSTFTWTPTKTYTPTNTFTPTIAVVSCGSNWTQAVEAPTYTPRKEASAVVMVDPADGIQKMWLIGGITNTASQGCSEVWASADGVSWVRKSSTAGWGPRYGHSSVVMPDPNNGGVTTLWVIGGRSGTHLGYDDVWKSTNGINWTRVTASAGMNAPAEHSSVVMVDPADGQLKMWVIGGTYGGTFSSTRVYASANGVNWVQKTGTGVFGPRKSHTSVVLNGLMWVIAGLNGASGPVTTNDVWSSPDGINWTQAVAAAPFAPRTEHASVVCNGQMWVIGGVNGTTAYNDVWMSPDGLNWSMAASGTRFSARQSHVAVALNNNVWVMGGSAGTGNLNDAWSTGCCSGGGVPFHRVLQLQEQTLTPTPTPFAVLGENLLASAVAAPNVSRNGEPIRFLFTLSRPAKVQLGVFALTGEQVFQTTVNGNAGANAFTWPLQNSGGNNLASGLYVYRLQVDNGNAQETRTGKVVVIH